MRRAEFADWEIGWWNRSKEFGEDTLVYPNYQCEGLFGPDQVVQVLGWAITVWHPDNCMVSLNATVEDREDVPEAIERLKKEVLTLCTHPNMYRGENLGRCYNRWHCPDCDGVFDIDSSD